MSMALRSPRRQRACSSRASARSRLSGFSPMGASSRSWTRRFVVVRELAEGGVLFGKFLPTMGQTAFECGFIALLWPMVARIWTCSEQAGQFGRCSGAAPRCLLTRSWPAHSPSSASAQRWSVRTTLSRRTLTSAWRDAGLSSWSTRLSGIASCRFSRLPRRFLIRLARMRSRLRLSRRLLRFMHDPFEDEVMRLMMPGPAPCRACSALSAMTSVVLSRLFRRPVWLARRS